MRELCLYLIRPGGEEKAGSAAHGGTPERALQCAADYARRHGIALPEKPGVGRAPKGKPHFTNVPGLFFSVSHSGGLWGCAVADMEVGFDMESVRARDYLGVARRFFHPRELAHVEAGGLSAFLEVWTAKESYVKYTGMGIGDGFGDFSVVSPNGGPPGAGLGVWMARPALPEGFAACLCAKEEAIVTIVWL